MSKVASGRPRSVGGPDLNLGEHQWPDTVRFLPYWGDRYWDGMDGQRILLLGESHYRKEGMSDSLDVTRPFTRDVFRGMAEPIRHPEDGPFFKALDSVLTADGKPDAQEAADAWRRVAFANLSQAFAGSQANQRPRNKELLAGGDVLVEEILSILKPTVVLALGRTTWRLLRHGRREEGLPPFLAREVNRLNGRRRYIERRDIWSLDYAGGSALMTWVYHPSWNVDTWQDRALALHHLIDQAQERR